MVGTANNITCTYTCTIEKKLNEEDNFVIKIPVIFFCKSKYFEVFHEMPSLSGIILCVYNRILFKN